MLTDSLRSPSDPASVEEVIYINFMTEQKIQLRGWNSSTVLPGLPLWAGGRLIILLQYVQSPLRMRYWPSNVLHTKSDFQLFELMQTHNKVTERGFKHVYYNNKATNQILCQRNVWGNPDSKGLTNVVQRLID